MELFEPQLVQSVKKFNDELLISLIQQGANVNCILPNSDSILSYAIECQNYSACEILIKYQADVNLTNNFKCTPLMTSTCYKDVKYLKLLISNKAKINAQDESGDTALTYAIFEDNHLAKDILLQAGANPNLKNIENKLPFDYLLQPISTSIDQCVNKISNLKINN